MLTLDFITLPIWNFKFSYIRSFGFQNIFASTSNILKAVFMLACFSVRSICSQPPFIYGTIAILPGFSWPWGGEISPPMLALEDFWGKYGWYSFAIRSLFHSSSTCSWFISCEVISWGLFKSVLSHSYFTLCQVTQLEHIYSLTMNRKFWRHERQVLLEDGNMCFPSICTSKQTKTCVGKNRSSIQWKLAKKGS